ncbi:uncharacterized protein CC84DRAFT_1176020 [Paraphaeosphaeria sporulosa]|uniref:Uncharacterized protein n=1 Tax=Paraphaeosphaeria sporulosa TaxID=1460663 RepID=A0A177CGF3_9PLEO|nr:uncharacterized protein CC84DRAFT_1176020 [Paraphaeosphaeria sporulosa]OAG05929.1 hypothetical protein CC84DRAFT_1176020 [Paraphaeosphaeria sporulosa]
MTYSKSRRQMAFGGQRDESVRTLPRGVQGLSHRLVGTSRWDFEECHVDAIGPQSWRWLGQQRVPRAKLVNGFNSGVAAVPRHRRRGYKGCSEGFHYAQIFVLILTNSTCRICPHQYSSWGFAPVLGTVPSSMITATSTSSTGCTEFEVETKQCNRALGYNTGA